MSGHTFEFGEVNGQRKIIPIGSKGDDFPIMGADPAMFRGPDAATPSPPPARTSKNRPTKPVNVLQAAKARLREVKREINRLRKLEAERDELTRLIQAAEQKPCAIVRDIAVKRG